MIKKDYRLREREVKKVLQSKKPFFSYGIVLNSIQNKKEFDRFAIVIWWKSVKNSVERVFFRRLFYDFIYKKIIYYNKIADTNKENKFYDFVFVIKKQTKLDKKNEKSINSFVSDLSFLIKNTWKRY